MDYSPLSDADIQEMLNDIGVLNVDDLFSDVPNSILNPVLGLGSGLSELETINHLKALAEKNFVFTSHFCGAGIYNHYIPPVVQEICQRNEFYTSYTPYQAEISQGFLQAIYEYQTSICNLTAMDATNASVYDGATAVCESLIMARKISRKDKFLILQPFNPEYLRVIKTYAEATDYEIEFADYDDYENKLNEGGYGGIVVQNPDFFGNLHDISELVGRVKKISKKLLVLYVCVESTSLGILKRPGTMGVDIVCGEGQSLGLSMSFGGPTAGYIATTKRNMRRLPGRIVGKTKEIDGDREGYLLTLQAREQHIRREKALSNICSNEALCMLAIQVYLSAMGYSGLRKVAVSCVKNINYLRNAIREIEGLIIENNTEPVYNEFLISIGAEKTENLRSLCLFNSIAAPYRLSDADKKQLVQGSALKFEPSKEYFLVCSTELHDRKQLDGFVRIIKEAMK